MTSSDMFDQYAALLCDVGLRLEPGQDVVVRCPPSSGLRIL